MRAKRSIKDSLKEYLNWCVSRLLLGGSRNDTVRDMVDAISDEIASGGGVVSQDQLDQTVQDITKSYGIADQTVLTSAESYTDQKIADVVDGSPEALDTLYELAKALGEDSNFATTVMDQIGQKLPTTTFENFIDNKAWTKDNLTKLSQLTNDVVPSWAMATTNHYLPYDDTRNTNYAPYNSNIPKGLTTVHLKNPGIDGLTDGSTYHSSIYITPWISASGGPAHNIAFTDSGNMWMRHGTTSWSEWVKVYHSGNFNPDNYLPLSGGKMITGDFQFKDGVAVRDAAGRSVVGLLDVAGDGVCVAVGNSAKKTRIVTPNDTPVYRNDGKGAYKIYDSGNLGNATTSQAGLMSAADKTKLDGLPDQINVVGQASSTYIFPGDPSELDSSSSSTHITLILGTASDFLDAFNNGKVFVSKTVTFSGVSVPSDITYNVLKSEDPDNPTIFSIIMSTVVWGHYIEITIDFENNEYQAITGTINGRISVNTSGTFN